MSHAPTGRSKITAPGTIGTTRLGSVGSITMPAPFSSSQRITPSAAARPKALPPVSRIASIWRTVFIGSSRSVSRVPGPPPRTSTAATAPPGTRTTVQPVAAPEPSVASRSRT
jgi:hypothetical protein